MDYEPMNNQGGYEVNAELKRPLSGAELKEVVDAAPKYPAGGHIAPGPNLDEAAFKYENELWESGYKNCGYSPQEVNDAFKAGANWREAQIAILPDNVDEAADTFAHNGDVNGVGGDDYEDDLRITFKAGAEWMAEQTHFVDASKMERLNVDALREWSMRFAPDIRDAVEATAYHFWNLAINARKEK